MIKPHPTPSGPQPIFVSREIVQQKMKRQHSTIHVFPKGLIVIEMFIQLAKSPQKSFCVFSHSIF